MDNNSTNGEEEQESLVEQPDDINRETPRRSESQIVRHTDSVFLIVGGFNLLYSV